MNGATKKMFREKKTAPVKGLRFKINRGEGWWTHFQC
jgi:hypothetical protein